MEILGYIASVLIGVSLGLIGSGGSILTVPVLVYLMGINPLAATASSLFIVGCTSLVGGLRAYSKKLVDFRSVTEFGIPSIFAIFIARHYLLPEIPETIILTRNISVSKELLLMLVFAVLMLLASFTMIRNRQTEGIMTVVKKVSFVNIFSLALLGLVVGTVTGLLGAGGGFLIIPSLVILLNLPMKTAVGTSLLIIAINSLFGFLFSLKQFEYNWLILISFTVLAIAGIFIGSRWREKISSGSLKKGFGWFIFLMGVYIIIKELFLK